MIAAPPEQRPTTEAETARFPAPKDRARVIALGAILALGALVIGVIAATRHHPEQANAATGMPTESAIVATSAPGVPTPTPLANKPAPTPPPAATVLPTRLPLTVSPTSVPPTAAPPVVNPPVVAAPVRQPPPAAPGNSGGHGKGKGKDD